MKPTVFIHTNKKQWLGAKIAEYSLKRNSAYGDHFDIRYIQAEEQPSLHNRHGHSYLRKRRVIMWDNDDLQSFTPTRFLAPQLMNYRGRALVIDPDVFAVADVYQLLSRDMQGKAILCRKISLPDRPAHHATSVMLLDCAQLRHWIWERDINRMFEHQLDYHDWINLYCEAPDSIGPLEEEWNHFDVLNDRTKLLHNTDRITQPWKTGLPIDFIKHNSDPTQRLSGTYQPHPDKNQERFFFQLVKEGLIQGVISEGFIHDEMVRGHLRLDAMDVIEQIDEVSASHY